MKEISGQGVRRLRLDRALDAAPAMVELAAMRTMTWVEVSAAARTDELVGFLLAELAPGDLARARPERFWQKGADGEEAPHVRFEVPAAAMTGLARRLEAWLAAGGGAAPAPVILTVPGCSNEVGRFLFDLTGRFPHLFLKLWTPSRPLTPGSFAPSVAPLVPDLDSGSFTDDDSATKSLFESLRLPASLPDWPSPPALDAPLPAARPAEDQRRGSFSESVQAPPSPAASAPQRAYPFESLRQPPPAAAEAQAPTRSAYGLLRCPETLTAGVEFDLAVGLSQDPEPGVAGGRFTLRDRAFDLVIQVVAQGFTPRPGESFRQTLAVTPAAPFPTFVLHLTPDPAAAGVAREIHASYTVEGQPVGFAVRYVTVARQAAAGPAAPATPATAPESPATGVNFPVPTAARGADLTVVIRRQPGSPGTLLWTFESRHPLALPDHAIETSIGEAPQDYTLRLMNQVNQNQGAAFELLVGHGRTIGQLMPDEFWQLLGDATRLSPRPTVLILSEDPFVPWELAIADEGVEAAPAAGSPFLGARTVVGRWVQPLQNRKRPALPPPSQVRVDAAAVVSGVYTQGAQRLEEAEAEAAEVLASLTRDLGTRASRVDATRAEVLQCLGGNPAAANLLHFSLHGSFDRTGGEDGLLLVDDTFLLPDQVRGVNLAGRPFVFLNACQVGQGTELLGAYAGMAAAFLFAGASAVIAPLWSIDDKVAHAIAHDFYAAALHAAEPVSAAELLRRERAKFVSNAQSATFAAYQFFGHPEMTLSLGRPTQPVPPPAAPPA